MTIFHFSILQNQVSLPWVDDHPEVFEDPHFTLNKQNSVEDRRSDDFSSENTPLPRNESNRAWGTSEQGLVNIFLL